MTYFSAGVEYSTMFLDHSIRNSNGEIERNLANMHGSLLDCDGNQLKSFRPRKPGTTNLQVFLSALRLTAPTWRPYFRTTDPDAPPPQLPRWTSRAFSPQVSTNFCPHPTRKAFGFAATLCDVITDCS